MRDFYEAVWADLPRTRSRGRGRAGASSCSRSSRPGDRVLDLGCGAGRFVAAAREAGADVVGVDIAEAALERARQVAPGADLRLLGARRHACPSATARSISCGARRCSSMSRTPSGCSRRSGASCAAAAASSSPCPITAVCERTLLALARYESHYDPLGQHLRFYSRRSLTAR